MTKELLGYRIWVFDSATRRWSLWGWKVWSDEAVARAFAADRITKRRWEVRPHFRSVRERAW